MRVHYALLMVLSLAFPVFGDGPPIPQISISGAENPVDIGRIVKLKASLKDKPKEIVGVRYNWFRVENNNLVQNDLEISADSTQIISGTGKTERTLNFVVIPVIEYQDGKADRIIVPPRGTQVTVSVVDVVPPQPPVPVPVPTPPVDVKPNLPEGQFDFAQKFASIIFYDKTITNAQKVELSKGLMANFNNSLQKINSNSNYQQIFSDVAVVNKAVFEKIGVTDPTAPLRADMARLLYNAYNGGIGKLSDVNGVKMAWGEIITGLNWVTNNVKE